MHCPSCRHANPEGAKFCSECGTRLPAPCPRCGHANAPGAKFCNECGQTLSSASQTSAAPPVTQTDLQTLIPADFARQLETARSQKTMAGERRIVTILFCDVKGSTAAASRFDPEDWAQVINGAFEYMIRPVYTYEGNVARLMGDGILAFFGAPVAHEDDPQRAVLAGLEMLAGFERYKAKVSQDWDLTLELRVGINTGLVMVGEVGSDLQMEYTAMGDAINIAARMEQTAVPGTVQVAEETYKRTAPVFDWEDLGPQEIKGRDAPLHTYRPLQARAQPGRLRGIEGLDAPMVGRRAESAQLRGAIGRLREGSGGIVFIVGEAGLGKSRLISEFMVEDRKSKTEDQKTKIGWHEAASLSYETAQPYALFQRLLRRIYGVEESDTPVARWEKFLPMLQHIPPDMADRGTVFEALFAARSQTGAEPPEGESFKRQLFELMVHLVAGWTGEGPQAIVLDDLHWTDPASVELLTHLFPLTEQHPLLLVCAMRPERSTPAWAAKETAGREFPHRSREIHLSALSPQDTDELVGHLLLVAELPERLRRQILEKTEGNPFFIEEVVRVLVDSGAVTREEADGVVRWKAAVGLEDIDIPGNLQTLLTARIDRLEGDARRTLQLASVIGRSFFYRVLEMVYQAASAMRVELDGHLRALQRAEMILEAARLPELEYAFRHALTQEAAYNTILVRQRREFHRQVGEAVETLFAGRLGEFFPVLAHHFRQAGDPRAQRYETLAGEAAFRLFAIPEAISHYQRALEGARRGPHQAAEITHLFMRLGRCYELQSEHEQALQTYEAMVEHARREADPQMELAGLVALATMLGIPTPVQDALRSRELSQQALELAARLGDREIESRIYWNILLAHMYSGYMDQGIPYGEKSAALARELGQQRQLAHALQDVSLAYMAVGDLENGRKALQEAQPLWEALGDQPMLAENWTNLAFERMMAGAFDEANSMYETGYQCADRIDNEWGRVNNRIFISQTHFARGEFDQAFALLAEFLPRARGIGHPASGIMLVQRSWLYNHIGLPDQACREAREAIVDSLKFEPFRYYALAVTADCLLDLAEMEEAEKLLQEAAALQSQKTLLEIDIIVTLVKIKFDLARRSTNQAHDRMQALLALLQRSGARFFLPETFLLKARLHLGENDLPAAREALLEGRETAKDIGLRPFLWQIHALLARVYDELGEAELARAERQAAMPVIAFIEGRLADPAQRGAFGALSERLLAPATLTAIKGAPS